MINFIRPAIIYLIILIILFGFLQKLRSTETPENPGVIMLLYHSLVKDEEVDEKKFKLGYEGAPYLYQRKTSQFKADMEYIKNSGKYEVISLYDLESIRMGEKELSKNSIIIAFDDGSISQYNLAIPILKELGFKATFFIISDKSEKKSDGKMSWDNLREIANYTDKYGEHIFSIESHSHTHLPITEEAGSDLYKERIYKEFSEPVRLIEKEVGKRPRFFSIPGIGVNGYKKKETIKIAKELEYWGVRSRLGEVISINKDLDMYSLSSFAVLNKTKTPVPLERWFYPSVLDKTKVLVSNFLKGSKKMTSIINFIQKNIVPYINII